MTDSLAPFFHFFWKWLGFASPSLTDIGGKAPVWRITQLRHDDFSLDDVRTVVTDVWDNVAEAAGSWWSGLFGDDQEQAPEQGPPASLEPEMPASVNLDQ